MGPKNQTNFIFLMQLMKFHQAPKKRLSFRGSLFAPVSVSQSESPTVAPSVQLSGCPLMSGDYLLRRVIRRRIDDKQTSTRNVSSSYHRLMRIAATPHPCSFEVPLMPGFPQLFSFLFRVAPCIFLGLSLRTEQKLVLLVLEFVKMVRGKKKEQGL